MSEEMQNGEIFQDPDYPEILPAVKNDPELSEEQRIEKIRHIVEIEFSAEIRKKEQDLEIIEERSNLARKSLARLRYAIVNTYYNNQQFQPTSEDIQQEVTFQKDPVARAKVHKRLKNEQKMIHPAIKKLLGGRDCNLDDLMKVRPPRSRGKADTSHVPISQGYTIPVDGATETLRSQIRTEDYDIQMKNKEIKREIQDVEEVTDVKVPRYIEPIGMDKDVLKIDTIRRNKQKEKFRIIIGNTSKYTPPHSDLDRSTHRWLLYVRGPRERPAVDHFLSHVTVVLHDSYAPHHILELKSPPFHLSRRGWGEFPVNLELHFRNSLLNPPVKIVHNLRLDRQYTGIQTLGAETVVDVWLYTDETMVEKQEEIFSQSKPLSSTTPRLSPLSQSSSLETIKPGEALTVDLKEKSWMEFEKQVTRKKNSCLDNFTISNVTMKSMDDFMMDEHDIKIESDSSLNLKEVAVINKEIMDSASEKIDTFKKDCLLHAGQHNGIITVKNEVDKVNFESKIAPHILSKKENCNAVTPPKKVQISLLKPNVKSLLKPSLLKNNQTVSSQSNPRVSLFYKSGFSETSLLQRIIHDHCYIDERYISEWNKNNGSERAVFSQHIDRGNLPKLVNSFSQNVRDPVYVDNFIVMEKPFTVDKLLSLKSNRVVLGWNDQSAERLQVAEDELKGLNKIIQINETIQITLSRMPNIRTAVMFLLKRLPIVDPLADTSYYKKTFPYATKTEETFFSLTNAKRNNLEWTRAKIINEFLNKYFFTHPDHKNEKVWSVKQILLFSHFHGFRPVILPQKEFTERITSREAFEDASQINSRTKIDVAAAISNKKTMSIIKEEILHPEPEYPFIKKEMMSDGEEDENVGNIEPISSGVYSSDDEIDICDTSSEKEEKCEKKDAADPSYKVMDEEVLPFNDEDDKLRCIYVERTCAEIGIELRNESVGSGYNHSLVHETILAATRCFVEDVLRRSLAVKLSEVAAQTSRPPSEKPRPPTWDRCEPGAQHEVGLRYVFEAIKGRPEFEMLTNAGLGTEPIQYTGKI